MSKFDLYFRFVERQGKAWPGVAWLGLQFLFDKASPGQARPVMAIVAREVTPASRATLYLI